MDFNNINELKENDFQEFVSINELWKGNILIPNTQGVYLILNKNNNIEFLEEGSGGFFQNRNPNVPIDRLSTEFIQNSVVLYIGKANNLRNRINQYLRFGRGLKAPHWGGRFIWQLTNHQNLIVCWKQLLNNENPREIERNLIQAYKEQFNNQRPYANLRD